VGSPTLWDKVSACLALAEGDTLRALRKGYGLAAPVPWGAQARGPLAPRSVQDAVTQPGE